MEKILPMSLELNFNPNTWTDFVNLKNLCVASTEDFSLLASISETVFLFLMRRKGFTAKKP